MAPAGEHLEADEVTRVEPDDRLVVRHDLMALEAAPKFVGGAQRQDGRVVRAR